MLSEKVEDPCRSRLLYVIQMYKQIRIIYIRIQPARMILNVRLTVE